MPCAKSAIKEKEKDVSTHRKEKFEKGILKENLLRVVMRHFCLF